MEITPATTNPVGAAAKKADETATANAMAGDFQTFLTLLTTQMRNQDPLKPMESTEFVAQLASFSAVEQQIRANDRLDRIAEILSGGTAEGLAAWIGREVRAPATAAFEGLPVEIEVTPVEKADRAVLVVTNDFGKEVARLAAPADSAAIAWNGEDSVGNRLPEGRYSFRFESYEGENLVDTQDGRVFTSVTEVRIADGTPMLVVAGGGQVPLDKVTGIR
jgi:flagellar basal-body rod modification protein FlgD